MKVELINPPGLDTSGALSQGTRAGDWIFVSGQRARDSDGNTVGIGDFEDQAERAFECVAQVLAEAGATFPTWSNSRLTLSAPSMLSASTICVRACSPPIPPPELLPLSPP